MLTLVLGGAKSGKSRHAEALAAAAGPRVAYVATGVATDPEMAARIAAHRARRPAAWETVEEPLAVAAAVAARSHLDAVVVDEWGTLAANHLLRVWREEDPTGSAARAAAALQAEVQALAAAARGAAHVIVVSPEVGWSVVPPSPLGRAFRDVLGASNQELAAAASQVFVCFAGIPVRIKGAGG